VSNPLDRVQQVAGTIQQGVGAVSRLGRALGLDISNPKAKTWSSSLRQPSWRGVPFQVRDGSLSISPQLAVHEYPYRDDAWVEPLGKGKTLHHIAGFLSGSDVIEQRRKLIQALNEEGPGELIHPSFGRIWVTLIRGDITERWDSGRCYEIRMIFMEQRENQTLAPSSSSSTSDAVKTAAAAAKTSAIGDFVKKISGALRSGMAVVSKIVSTANRWSRQIKALISDVTNLSHIAGSLFGNYGRYNRGSRKSSRVSRSATLSTLASTAAASRSAVSAATSSLISIGKAL